jgi:hypothetical protein
VTDEPKSPLRRIIVKIRGLKLHTQILIGLILGAVLGPLMGDIAQWIKPLGDAFINLLIMIVVPLVMASLIVGTASLGDLKKLGRIGIKTVAYYLVATVMAVAFGLGAGKVFNPGAGMDEDVKARMLTDYAGVTQQQLDRIAEKPGLAEFLVNIVPRNPFRAMVETNFLQIIFFALLFGIALTILNEERRQPILRLLTSVNDAMIILVKMVMRVAPIGVFALIAAVAAQFGYGVLLTLLKYVVVTIGTMIVFVLTIYPSFWYVSDVLLQEVLRGHAIRFLHVFQQRHAADKHTDIKGRSGCLERRSLVRVAAGCHHQHERDSNLSGRKRRLHRAGIWHCAGAARPADRGVDRHAGIHRCGGCAGNRDGHTYDSAPTDRDPGGRYRAGGGSRTHTRHDTDRGKRHGRHYVRCLGRQDGGGIEHSTGVGGRDSLGNHSCRDLGVTGLPSLYPTLWQS